MPHFAAGQLLTAAQVNDIAHTGTRILDEQVLETPEALVTFSNIDQNFRNLQVVFSGGVTTPSDQIRMQFNGDTGGNYRYIAYVMRGDDTFAAFPSTFTAAAIQIGFHTTSDLLNSTSVTVFGYQRTDRQKLVTGQFVNGITSTIDADVHFNSIQGYWQSTAAITSIDIFPQTAGDEFVAGSIFQLFGIGQ